MSKKKKARKKSKNNVNKKSNSDKKETKMNDAAQYLKVLITVINGVISLFINDDDTPKPPVDDDVTPDELSKRIQSWAPTDKGPMVQIQDIKFSPTRRYIVLARKTQVKAGTPKVPGVIDMSRMPADATPCPKCDRGNGPTGHFPRRDGSHGPCFNCVDPALPWGSPTRGLGWVGHVKAQMNAKRKAQMEARTNPQQENVIEVGGYLWSTDMIDGGEDVAVEPVFS